MCVQGVQSVSVSVSANRDSRFESSLALLGSFRPVWKGATM